MSTAAWLLALVAVALSPCYGAWSHARKHRRTPQGDAGLRPIGRCLCGHHGFDHSEILIGNPCLTCDCPGHMRDDSGPRYADDGFQRVLPLAYFAQPDKPATVEKETQ